MAPPLTRVFLLSHMRAYSSLIGHILGSHPEINGYYEMQQSYLSDTDLQQQLARYTEQDTIKPGSHFLFDKILHNRHQLNLELASLSDASILLALREPQQSIKSIIHLFRQKPTAQHYADPAEATNYYLQRLQQLATFCQRNPRRYFYFDAAAIQQSSQQTLDTLSRWLQLSSPLQTQYQCFAKTGQARAGDSSEHIKSGEIQNRENHYHEIELAPDLIEQAQRQYESCRKIACEQAIESIRSH